MPTLQLYIIDYRLHGARRSFVIRHPGLSETEAWHWASCDVGFGHIPRSANDRTRKTTRSMAERYGISEVAWRLSGAPPRQLHGHLPHHGL
ncbi:DUF6555 family protein [Pseudomonas sp. NPDC007930]|uniref:DUF6555 family protein n=1 Tax=Pseudomonas sp. NPDC007930 TaxID=3364417 RepID=UPI0036E865E4